MPSFLVTDFGIAHTRTVLIDLVEGQHRLITGAMSHTTVAPPLEDATIALGRNLEQMSSFTGRVFMDDEGFRDIFIATASSAGRPLRAVLVGLMEVSLSSARRALTGTYIEVVDTISLADYQTEEAQINTILKKSPDVIMIVGGTDNGNEDLVRQLVTLVELAVRMLPIEHRPRVMFAGNTVLQSWVRKRLDEPVILFIAENVRPSIDRENLNPAKLQLAQVFDDFLKHQPGGFHEISAASSTGIIPTAQSVANVVRYLDTLDENGILYLDVGSGTSSLLASYESKPYATIRSNLGIGHNILALLEEIDWRDVDRWLPFPFSLDKYEEWVYNKWLTPRAIPHTLSDLFIERAIVREIVRHLIDNALAEWDSDAHAAMQVFSPIIVGGAVFTANLAPGLAAMLILDAIQPEGVVELWQDPYALASALGAMSQVNAAAVVQVVDHGAFVRVGTAFCPSARVPQPRAKMNLEITLPDGNVLEEQVSAGEIKTLTLLPNIEVEVSIRLPRGLTIEGKRRLTKRVRTGTAGIIFDMRGRPLRLPSAAKRRRQLIGNWFTAVTGITLDEALHEDVPAEVVETSLDEMTAAIDISGTTDEFEVDFPEYDSLPETPISAELAALVGEDGSGEDEEDDGFDLAKELGLR